VFRDLEIMFPLYPQEATGLIPISPANHFNCLAKIQNWHTILNAGCRPRVHKEGVFRIGALVRLAA
jgi:hypothetical protein